MPIKMSDREGAEMYAGRMAEKKSITIRYVRTKVDGWTVYSAEVGGHKIRLSQCYYGSLIGYRVDIDDVSHGTLTRLRDAKQRVDERLAEMKEQADG